MGWLKNIFNKIIRRKQLPEGKTPNNIDNIEIPNEMNNIRVDTSSMGNKTRRDIQLEEAILLAQKYNYTVEDLKGKGFEELDLLDLKGCISIGLTLNNGYLQQEAVDEWRYN